MSITTPIFTAGAFTQGIRPISNITPFTYRDGLTYLMVLEEIIKYVNTQLTAELNINLQQLVDDLNLNIQQMEAKIVENETEYVNLLTQYMDDMQTLVDTINNRVGNEQIQRETITGDYLVQLDPTWPTAHPIGWQITQDAVGGHEVTFEAPIVNPDGVVIDTTPGAVTEFWITPQPDGSWVVSSVPQALQSVLTDLAAEVQNRIDGDAAEAQARDDAIAAEASDRDAAIASAVNAEAATRDAADTSIREDFASSDAAIATGYQNADNALRDSLTVGGKVNNALDFVGVDPTGNTDSTSGLQLALDASENGVLYLPEGVYIVSTQLYIRKNTSLIGFGAPVTILRRASGYSSGIMTNLNTSDTTTTAFNGPGEIHISGVTFDGNSAPNTGNIVSFIHTRNITIRDCVFLTCTGAHHLELNSTFNALIENCEFRGFIYMSSQGLRKEAVQIDCANPISTGVGATDGTESRRITVRGCYFASDFRGNPAPSIAVGSHAMPLGGQGYYSEIVVENNTGLGMLISGVWADTWRYSTIRNNHFTLRQDVSSYGVTGSTNRRIICFDACVRNTISGNDLFSPAVADTPGSLSCIVLTNESSNNHVTDNRTYGATYGINLSLADYNLVENNQTYQSNSYGLILHRGTFNKVSNNIFREAGYPGSVNAVIYVNGNETESSQRNSITNNVTQTGTNAPAGEFGVSTVASYALNTLVFGNHFNGITTAHTGSSTSVVDSNFVG